MAEGTYERNDFLVTLQSLKLSADENSKLELTELKAIHKAVKENTEFVSKLTSGGSADGEVKSEVAATSVAESSSSDLFKPMTTLLAAISDHTNHISEEAFKIRNIMMGSTDIREAYEKNFASQMGFAETSSIREQLAPEPPEQSEPAADSRAAEDQQDEEAHRSKLGKMFDTMSGYLKSIAGKAKTAAKVGIIATLTALGLLWLLKFMETESWKKISKSIAEFINTGLPIILSTINAIADGIIWTFTTLKTIWDNSLGWVLNKVGKIFGITKEVEEVDEEGKGTGVMKQVGYLGDGIGLLIAAFAALTTAVIAYKVAAHPVKAVKAVGGFAKRIFGGGGGGAPGAASLPGGAAPSVPGGAGGGWTSKLAGGMGNLGKGIADLGKGIGKGLGKLIELTLKGLAAGLKALGDPKVLLGAAAMVVLSAAVWVFSKAMQGFSKVTWKSVAVGITTVLAFGALAVLASFMAPMLFIGAAAIGAIGIALIPFAAAAKLAEGPLEKFGNIFKQLAKVSWQQLVLAGPALAAMAVGFTALSAGGLLSGMADAFTSLFASDPIKKLERIAAAAPGVDLIGRAFGRFGSTIGDFLEQIKSNDFSFASEQIKKLVGAFDTGIVSGAVGVGSMLGLSKVFESMSKVSWGDFTSNLVGLGEAFKMFGINSKNFNADQLEAFIDAIDHDEAVDMLALGKMFEGMGSVRWDSLSKFFQGGFEKLEIPTLEQKLVDVYIKFFNKLIEVFDKWPNNLAWPGAIPMESAGTAPPLRRQPIATGDGVVVPRVSTTVDADGNRTVRTSRKWTRIAGEDWAPGQDLSKKQYAVLSTAVSMGNRLSPDEQKAYDKYEGKSAVAVPKDPRLSRKPAGTQTGSKTSSISGIAPTSDVTDWDSVIQKSLASGETLSEAEFNKLFAEHGDFDDTGERLDAWSEYQAQLSVRKLKAAGLTEGKLVGGEVVKPTPSPKGPGQVDGQSAAREDKSRAIGVKVTALRTTHERLQTLAKNDPKIQQRKDFLKEWNIHNAGWEQGYREKGSYQEIDGKRTWVSEAKEGWREAAVSSGFFKTDMARGGIEKIRKVTLPSTQAARDAKESLNLEEKRLTASMYGRDYDKDRAAMEKIRGARGNFARSEFKERYHEKTGDHFRGHVGGLTAADSLSQLQLRDQMLTLKKLGYDTSAMKTKTEVSEAFMKERNKYIEPPAKKVPKKTATVVPAVPKDPRLSRKPAGTQTGSKTSSISGVAPTSYVDSSGQPIKEAMVERLQRGGTLTHPTTREIIPKTVRLTPEYLKFFSNPAVPTRSLRTKAVRSADGKYMRALKSAKATYTATSKSPDLAPVDTSKVDSIVPKTMASAVPEVKPRTGPKLISHLTKTAKKHGYGPGDIVAASVYASGATPMIDPGGRGGELWQLAKYPEAKSTPSPLVKDTSKKLQASQTELANAQQGAAGTGRGDVNVGGTVHTNVDNSKHDQYNVGNGSSTPDRRMLQYAALKDF